MASNNPEVWGPHAWVFLHSVALGYPDNPTEAISNAYFDFFQNVGKVLPCGTCREHYMRDFGNGNTLRDALFNNEALFRWTVDAHNRVNLSTGKRSVSYSEAYDLLSEPAHPGRLGYQKWIMLLIIVLVVLGMCYYFGWCRKKSCCQSSL